MSTPEGPSTQHLRTLVPNTNQVSRGGYLDPLGTSILHKEKLSNALEMQTVNIDTVGRKVPRDSRYQTFEASGSRSHTLYGCWD